jgi:DNA-binding response OmpR family regulator
MRILLVGNESRFAVAVTTALRSRGHDVEQTIGSELEVLAGTPPDVIMVGVDSSRHNGLRICREVRARSGSAIIGVTSRGEESCGVAALREGADDYVVRPVSLAELLARIDAVRRRCPPSIATDHALGRLRIDLHRHQVTVDWRPVGLTRKEFQLLTALARHPGTVVTRQRLLAEVWQLAANARSRTLDSHITNLRTKLGHAVTVENIRGVGYRLVAEPSEVASAGR